jgi:hypothetical protein
MANTNEDPTLAALISTYQEADEEYKKAQARRAKSKQMARGLVEVGIGSDEQKAWVTENIPVIERKRKGAEDNGE